jgi:hypothetical protein
MGELKLCLSVGMASSCRTVKHITPISAAFNKPSAAKQIQVVCLVSVAINCVVNTWHLLIFLWAVTSRCSTFQNCSVHLHAWNNFRPANWIFIKFNTGDETEIYGHILLMVEITDNSEHFTWRFAILLAFQIQVTQLTEYLLNKKHMASKFKEEWNKYFMPSSLFKTVYLTWCMCKQCK